jgi:hypothetical protein
MPRPPRPRPTWLLALALTVLGAREAAQAASVRRLAQDGTWTTFSVDQPGDKVGFGFEQRSGCRYRMTIEPLTLARPVVDLAAEDGSPQRFGAPERGQPAVHSWDAEGTRLVVVEVSGFSAMTGTARIQVVGLGMDGRAQKKPEPWLGLTGDRARVGDLVLGEVERWPLDVEPGATYAIEPSRGEAPGVLLRVVGPDGQELGKTLRPWLPFDTIAVRIPAPTAPADGAAPPGRTTLEVRGQGGAGGTYGVRLVKLPDGAPLAPAPSSPPPPVTRGPLEGEPQGFQANPGDVAMLFSPRGPEVMSSAVVEERLARGWQALDPDAPVGTLRSQEGDHMTVVRLERSGAYRFVPFPAGRAAHARPKVISAEHLAGAPILLGLASDPRVRAKPASSWRTIGVGAAVPGFDYLFVADGAPEAGLAMRVRSLEGTVLASRPASGEALTLSPGLGPSLRFRVREVTLVKLEVRGSGPLVRAVMRRASN